MKKRKLLFTIIILSLFNILAEAQNYYVQIRKLEQSLNLGHYRKAKRIINKTEFQFKKKLNDDFYILKSIYLYQNGDSLKSIQLIHNTLQKYPKSKNLFQISNYLLSENNAQAAFSFCFDYYDEFKNNDTFLNLYFKSAILAGRCGERFCNESQIFEKLKEVDQNIKGSFIYQARILWAEENKNNIEQLRWSDSLKTIHDLYAYADSRVQYLNQNNDIKTYSDFLNFMSKSDYSEPDFYPSLYKDTLFYLGHQILNSSILAGYEPKEAHLEISLKLIELHDYKKYIIEDDILRNLAQYYFEIKEYSLSHLYLSYLDELEDSDMILAKKIEENTGLKSWLTRKAKKGF